MDILIAETNSLLDPGAKTKTLMSEAVSAYGFDGEREKKMFVEFAKYVAEEYKKRLQDAVRRQKYSGLWKPLSREYLEYKKKNHLSTRIWEASGTLINSIAVSVFQNRIIVGVSRTAKEPGSGKPCYLVAKEMEYGTETKPPRPLFGPVKRDLERDIPVLYAQWILNVYGPVPKIPEDGDQDFANRKTDFGSGRDRKSTSSNSTSTYTGSSGSSSSPSSQSSPSSPSSSSSPSFSSKEEARRIYGLTGRRRKGGGVKVQKGGVYR